MNKKANFNFESKLEELEGIVQSMESNKIGLDQNLKSFENGVKLYKECKDYLQKIEKKIEKISVNLKN